jgi:hypothetical protein
MSNPLLPGIHNVGEFFAANYFGDDLARDILDKSGLSAEGLKEIRTQVSPLKNTFERYKRDYIETAHTAVSRREQTGAWHERLLAGLGYSSAGAKAPTGTYDRTLGPDRTTWVEVGDGVIPVRQILHGGGERPQLFVMEMPSQVKRGDEPTADLYHVLVSELCDLPEDENLSLYDGKLADALRALFLLPEEQGQRPRYVLLLAGSSVFLLEEEHWQRDSYLHIELDELFGAAPFRAGPRASHGASAKTKLYETLYCLIGKTSLVPSGGQALLDKLSEESHRKAVAVTKELKEGVVLAVEALANEAVWWQQQQAAVRPSDSPRGEPGQPPADAAQLAEECLRLVYRLLFLFYAESRDELELLPLRSQVYQRGYSLEMLRDLEQVRLDATTENGYYFDESLTQLFELLWNGHQGHLLEARQYENDRHSDNGRHPETRGTSWREDLGDSHASFAAPNDGLSNSFGLIRIDSPLFDPAKLKLLGKVKFRNKVWQEIIQRLSLSQRKAGKDRGRISYANLDINQLGSVYEGLLAYRGIFAQEELIEVHKKGKPEEGTHLVPRTRLDDFAKGDRDPKKSEVLHEETDNGRVMVVHPKGKFVYRLNGRDRQKSASYYTPESLTRTTVYFALEEIRERLKAGRMDQQLSAPLTPQRGEPGQPLTHQVPQANNIPKESAAGQNNTPKGSAAGSKPPEAINIPKRSAAGQNNTPKGSAAGQVTPMSASELLSLTILEPAMGAAAFQNEAINQLAELYLEYRQLEVLDEGGKRIEPSRYREELRRVKAHIAANNVYGVDLNATAIELGRLSLWLNCLHTGMETPYFGHRLGYGNAVVGCWLKTYPKRDFLIDPKAPKRKLEWWKKEPTDVRLPFHTTGAHETLTGYRKPERTKDSVYHFLLPDMGMAAAADNKMVKLHFKEKAEHARNWRKAFCEPITADEHQAFVRLSAKLDSLLSEHIKSVDRVNALNASNRGYYGAEADTSPAKLRFDYRQKEQHLDQLQKDEAPYARIRMVMDYWCALWYWDIRDAEHLPKRGEFIRDVAAILEVDLNAQPAPINVYDDIEEHEEEEAFYEMLTPTGLQGGLFGNVEQLPLRVVRDREVMYESAREKLMALHNRPELFKQHPRLQLVSAYAKTHRFFHCPLEFYEVFARRGGFDLVLGNPPWIKLEFDESGIVSEIDPKVVVAGASAPQVRKRIAGLLDDANFADLYFSELTAMEGSSNFLNSEQTYPLLKGQQTNLYKCIVETGFRQIGQTGVMGLVHPEGLYDDPKGAKMRKEIYRRLLYHFQFKNELQLFAEVDHHVIYGSQIYGTLKSKPDFISLSNLFTAETIQASIKSTGTPTALAGYKRYNAETEKFEWNIDAHPERAVRITEKELRTFARAFENSDEWESAKLVSVHATQIVSVLEKLSVFKGRVGDVDTVTTECWHETNSQNHGITKAKTTWPNIDLFELIYSGPHFFAGTPLYKTPREKVTNNSHYDVIDLTVIPADFVPRTNYVPAKELVAFAEEAGGGELPWGGRWIDGYGLAVRQMLSISGERTFHPAILIPKTSHVNTVLSTKFRDTNDMLEMFAFCSSIVCDFFIKSIGAGHVHASTLQRLPHGLGKEYESKLRALALRLNCLTEAYAPLWERNWKEEYSALAWSLDDARLSPHSACTGTWSHAHSALRTPFERRWALVELDVLVAKALGLTFEELKLIYEVQFPVLQQNELDTYYDKNGQIVWTCSKGLKGVGIHSRSEWDVLKAENRKQGDDPYRHVIDGKYSELYAGEERWYWGPYERRDRVGDYLLVWGSTI